MPAAVFVPAELNDLSVDVALTTPARGDLFYRGAAKWNNLPAGTGGQFLRTNGVGADPSWATVDLSTLVTLAPATDARNVIVPTMDGVRPLVVKRNSNTTLADLFQAVNENDVVIANISSANYSTVGVQSVVDPGSKFNYAEFQTYLYNPSATPQNILVGSFGIGASYDDSAVVDPTQSTLYLYDYVGGNYLLVGQIGGQGKIGTGISGGLGTSSPQFTVNTATDNPGIIVTNYGGGTHPAFVVQAAGTNPFCFRFDDVNQVPALRVSASATTSVLEILSSAGLRIGNSSSQPIALFGATPVVQRPSTTDLRQVAIDLGLLASGGATPLNLNGGAITSANITATDSVFKSDANNITLQSSGGTLVGRIFRNPATGGVYITADAGDAELQAGASAGDVVIGANNAGKGVKIAMTGGLSFFAHAVVAQQPNASQATISAVTDANAKAALQSFYDLLKNYGLAPATA